MKAKNTAKLSIKLPPEMKERLNKQDNPSAIAREAIENYLTQMDKLGLTMDEATARRLMAAPKLRADQPLKLTTKLAKELEGNQLKAVAAEFLKAVDCALTGADILKALKTLAGQLKKPFTKPEGISFNRRDMAAFKKGIASIFSTYQTDSAEDLSVYLEHIRGLYYKVAGVALFTDQKEEVKKGRVGEGLIELKSDRVAKAINRFYKQ